MNYKYAQAYLEELKGNLLHATTKRNLWKIKIDAYNKFKPKNKFVGRRIAFGLNTDNYGLWLASLHQGCGIGGDLTLALIDITNTSRTFNTYSGNPVTSAHQPFNYTAVGNLVYYVQMGTGTTPADKANYNIETPIAGTADISGSYTEGGNVVSLTCIAHYGTTKQPTECCLFAKWQDEYVSSPTVKTILLDRTVFSALDSATDFPIDYSITLG